MDLVITSEHRFVRTPDGSVWTAGIHSYEVAARYLSVFDNVKVVARVCDVPSVDPAWRKATGPGVTFAVVPYYVGARQCLARYQRVRRSVAETVRSGAAVILRVSSYLAALLESALRKTGYPYAVEVVNDPWEVFAPGATRHPARPILRPWFTFQLRRQCRRAAAAAYVTERVLQKRYPCPGYCAGVSDVVLPPEALVSAPRKPAKHGGPYRVVTVGSLEQVYKGTDILIRALAAVRESGVAAHLDILGDGRLRPEFERLAGALGVGSHITFHGQVAGGAPVRRLLDTADLFVLPSRTEGLPRAMVEAMARALPCVGSDVGGIPELLAREDLVRVNDVVGLARQIGAVLSSPARMALMSARNLARARDFADEALASRRREFLESVREATTAWLNRSPAAAECPKREAPVW